MAARPVRDYYAASLASFAIGVAVGLAVAWGVFPVQYTNADPSDLRSSYKDEYIRMIGAAFALDGNLARARLRLSQLNLGTPSTAVSEFMARQGSKDRNAKVATALVHLSSALGAPSTIQANNTRLQTGSEETGIPRVLPTQTLPVYELVERTAISCTDEPEEAHLRFVVRAEDGKELPNVGIQVRWQGGEETIFTGLKPERGIGYADLLVRPGTFAVSILNGQIEPISGLVVAEPTANCQFDSNMNPRGWKLVFQRK